MNKKIEFTKVYDVKSPVRAHDDDAGTDWFVPACTKEFVDDFLSKNEQNMLTTRSDYDEKGRPVMLITIPPGEQVNIPSGIKVNILDKCTYLQAENKSGVATKFHLITGANIIDAGYRGMVHINLMNVGSTYVTISTGQKIVQFIHKEYIGPEWSEITNEEYDNLESTARGEGGFGSTGTK